MGAYWLKRCVAVCVAVLATACGGGGGDSGGPPPPPPPPPQNQSIAFAQSGPLNVLLGSTTANAASGGSGTGVVTYASSNPGVAIVDAVGTATAVGVGVATITATKAADANYLQAQSTYTIRSQTADTASAFIGATGANVIMPASANGRQFGRARVADCSVTDTVATCANAELSSVDGAPVMDARATLLTPAYYAIVDGAAVGTPIDVRADRFSNRIGHAVVHFKGRYWVIAGGEPVLPGASPIQHAAKADVWSSADGRAWKLETSDGGFGARWFPEAVVFNDRIWLISGARLPTPASPAVPWFEDVWSSADGITWTQEAAHAGFPWWPTALDVVVFNGEMLAISGGRVYSSTTGVFALKSPGTQAIPALTGTTLGRSNASLTIYNNQLWYIGGKVEYPINVPPDGDAMNDVWRSSDGVSWTQVTANAPFSPRYRHSAFVATGRLWVLGGQGATNGVAGAVAGDVWSTTDGVNWTEEAAHGLVRGYLMPVVQEPNQVTLIAGVQVGYADNVWHTTDGANWSERSPHAQFAARHAPAVEFRSQLWVVGGTTSGSSSQDRDTNEIWRSSDGLNWSRVTTVGPVFPPRTGHGLVVFNDRLWVVGGWNNSSGGPGTQVRMNDVWSSADGVTWTQETSAATFAARVGHAVAVHSGRLWVIGGSGTSGDLNDVWSSTDGVSWQQATASAAFSPRSAARAVAFSGELWLIGGGTATTSNEIWRSPDGVAWSQVPSSAPMFSPRTRHAAAVLNGRMYVAGGVSSDDYATAARYNDVWSSADGLTWRREVEHAAFSPRSLHALVAYNNELWVIGGFGAGLLNDVWRSSDGVDWRIGFSHAIAAP